MFTKKTIKDIDLRGKRVLLRADYNVPIDDKGNITDDYRIKQSLPTIKYILDQDARLVICSHLGRPTSANDTKCSLFPVAKRLKELLGQEVEFVPDCIGERAEKAVSNLQPKGVVLLENLRFHPGEEKNDAGFAVNLAKLADIFVQDGFGVVHRAHASTDAITHDLPSVAGFLLEKEVDVITDIMHNPKRPLMAVIGGSKVADKVEMLYRFIEIADFVVVGGAMANVFLLVEDISVGASLADTKEISIARDVIEKARNKAQEKQFIFYVPQDGVVASKIDSSLPTRIVSWNEHVISDIQSYPKRPPHSDSQVRKDEMVLDIGPFSGAFIVGGMQLANTIVWNGTMGVTETTGLQGPIGPYAHGTELVIEAMTGQFGHRPFSFVGGGDTVGYIEKRKMVDMFNHVSTGGGASLELMIGHKLPGVEALLDKEVQGSHE